MNSPAGWHSLTPRIFAEDAKALVKFLQEVFLAEGEYRATRPSELKIGDSMLLVSNRDIRSAYTACLYVYVPDIVATFDRAVSAGVRVVEEPQDTHYGDKRAVVTDAWGNMWQIAQYQPR